MIRQNWGRLQLMVMIKVKYLETHTGIKNMSDRTIKSAYGLTFTKKYIFDHTLEIIPLLCWKPEDIGLTRIHSIENLMFKTRKEAIGYAKENDLKESQIKHFFEWVNAIDGRSGIERETFLREEYWPRREQVANILFDSVLQSHPKEAGVFFSKLIGIDLEDARLVSINTTNTTRQFTGQPDTVLLDEKGKNIIFIEIKIGRKSTKYTLEQHFKYMGLNALSSCKELFPDYSLYNILLGPKVNFLSNTTKLEPLHPIEQDDHSVIFDYSTVMLDKFSPEGSENISELINARMAKLLGVADNDFSDRINSFKFQFFDWSTFYDLLPTGDFKDNLEQLMPYLNGEDQCSE